MADVKWIKITTDIFDDEKILLIESLPDGDALVVIWFKLLCLAGKQNNGGIFMINDRIPFTVEMLSTIFRRNQATVRLALDTFEQFGMIETINDVITIPNWEKHQNIEGMEKIREQNRIRKQNQRERERLAVCDSHVTVTECHATDKNKNRLDKNINNRFTPPTIDEVTAYCHERGNRVDPERFIAYYESNGWKVGRNSMKDWKAAVRTWEKRDDGKPKQTQFQDFEQRQYDADALEEALMRKGI